MKTSRKAWHVQAGVIMISDDFFTKLYQTRLLRLLDKMGQKRFRESQRDANSGREMHRRRGTSHRGAPNPSPKTPSPRPSRP